MELDYLKTIIALDPTLREDIYCADGYAHRWVDISIDNSKVHQYYAAELSKEDIKWKKRSINNVLNVLEQLFLKEYTWLDVMHLHGTSISLNRSICVWEPDFESGGYKVFNHPSNGLCYFEVPNSTQETMHILYHRAGLRAVTTKDSSQ